VVDGAFCPVDVDEEATWVVTQSLLSEGHIFQSSSSILNEQEKRNIAL